jgi:uncharacterized FAD-dependent dehydrogenase
MLRLTGLHLPLDHAPEALAAAVAQRLGIAPARLRAVHVFKRSHDARKPRAIVFIYTVDVDVGDDEPRLLARHARDPHVRPAPDMRYVAPVHAPADFGAGSEQRPVVVGLGPCGLFAALLLAQMGLRPIVLERGRPVRERTRDTWGLWRRGVLEPESNVQFGEGGAGTFSDGKLWTQISDPRHLTRKVLEELVQAGAPDEILWIAKPHIGTFRLVGVVEKMRATIVALGGEVRFRHRVIGLDIEHGRLQGLRISTPDAPVATTLPATHAVLAPGHSARDTFAMLHAIGVRLEPKPFSIGVRIEHPQGMIDRARFGPRAGHPELGAADYKLVHHAHNGRSVYSFCMCPGGTVVAATSEPERVVTNGMSQYSRNERNANAGLVVGIEPRDFALPGESPAAPGSVHPLAGVAFQRHWESLAYALGGGGYRAPAQLVGDFLAGRASRVLGEIAPSYQPGVQLGDLAGALPAYAVEALREALPAFERRIAGFARADAVMTGVETRTSSPLRIPRGADRQSTSVVGLYPAGEGAGYAGGIMSAAVDGIETAQAVAASLVSGARVRAQGRHEGPADP